MCGLVQLGWRRRFGVGCGGGRGQIGWRGFPWGQRGSMIVLIDFCRLLACGETVVRLVPEGGIVCRAKFRVEGDVSGGWYRVLTLVLAGCVWVWVRLGVVAHFRLVPGDGLSGCADGEWLSGVVRLWCCLSGDVHWGWEGWRVCFVQLGW